MAVVPHTVDIVVADMARALSFYRLMGLAIEPDADRQHQLQVQAGPVTLGFIEEALVRRAIPGWPTPVGQRVTVAFRCDEPGEVDAVYSRLVAAGHEGRRAPWDAPWGQRYAFLGDPDGNRVDLFAELPG